MERLDILHVEDPGDRERELYRQRQLPRERGEPYPRVWLAVPIDQVGRGIMENPLYDVDDGRVILSHRDFFDWAWALMETAARTFVRQTFISQTQERRSADTSNVADLISHTLTTVARPILDQENGIEARRRFEKRSHTISVCDTGDAQSLLEMAKKFMPPCMARHVWRALVHGRHPKNEARLMLSMFLLEAGYTIGETERVMYLLYEADQEFVVQRTGRVGGWNKEMFKREYGAHVELTSKRMREGRTGAFGCASLTAKKASGCPFTENPPFETRAFLSWAQVDDIEDIMRFKHPQERCCSYFQDRNPDVTPLVIKHPNQFLRRTNGNSSGGSSDEGKKIKLEEGI